MGHAPVFQQLLIRMSTPSFCSQIARSHDVAPMGTATEAAHWLLIEDPSPWGRKAVREADWHAAVADSLAAWQAEVPDLRVQLIRRGLTTWDTPDRIRCMAVRAGPEGAVHTWTLDTYADLATLDVPAVVHSAEASADEEPIVLTCTNGRRDACCAKWGRPVAQAMAAAYPHGAWQTSHLGGHRFAPTVLVLPHGTQYGWLAPDDAPAVVAAHRSDRLYALDRVRGHVGQSRPVQAACLAVRARHGIHRIDAVHGEGIASTGTTWTVKVHTPDGPATVEVRRVKQDVAFAHSCRSDETKPCVAWVVDEHER